MTGRPQPTTGSDTPSWELLRSRLRLPDAVWSQTKPVVTVTAPPGYGKSTLLSQWREQSLSQGRQVIQLTANTNDRDGNRLILDLAAALGREESDGSQSLLDSYGNEGKLALIKALLADIDVQGGAALMIDDTHELVDDSAQSVLRLFVQHQTDNLLIVFSGRAHPAASVSKALLEGRLYHFTDVQLAFTAREIGELLRQHHIQPREPLVARLQEHTQGWPAAVRLVALSLRDDEAWQDDFLTGLGENPRALTEYLNQALFSQLPPHIYNFLLPLSLLPAFTAPLASAVTGVDDAGALLDELERRALPITRRGEREPTYVLHPLVRDYLRDRLTHGDGAQLAESRNRAVEWLTRHRRVDTAIEVCLNAGEVQRAASLINEHAALMVQQYGRHTTYLYWINKLPADVLRTRPEIRLKQAWSLDFLRRHEEAETVRFALEQEFLRQVDADGNPCPNAVPADFEQSLELQRCVQLGLRDLAPKSTRRTRQWLEHWPDASAVDRATAHAVLAFSTKGSSDFENGLRHARRAQTLARQAGAPYMLTWANMLLVANLTKQGHCRQALQECDEYLDELSPQLGRRAPAVMMLHAMRAALLYEFNRLAEASAALDQGLTALTEQSSVDPMIMGYVTLARLQNAHGECLDALETLAEGEILGRANGLPRLAIALGAERGVLLLRQGENQQARNVWEELRRTAQETAPTEDAFNDAVRDKAARIRARMALRDGDVAAVDEATAEVLQHATRTGQKRKQVELYLLRALARHRGGDTDGAIAVLRDALNLAMPEGYVRTFCDEGPAMRELLACYLRRAEDAGISPAARSYVEQLLATGNSNTEDDLDAAREPACTLTSREVEILSKLPPGPSNRQLSDALFITEATLKWHLRNIYAKLGVSNRLAAVDRARELQLLDE